MDSAIHLGILLRDHRRAVGLTQRQLAEIAGIRVGVVRDLEQGVTKCPRPRTMRRLGDALHADFDLGTLAGARSGRRPVGADGNGVGKSVSQARSWVTPLDGADRSSRFDPVLRISVLGPLSAFHRDVPLGLGPACQRAVLAMLAVYPNVTLHRDMIIDTLWNDDPPPTARAMIQTYISRLRHVLEPGVDSSASKALVSTGTSYMLRLSDNQLDSTVFRRLCLAARAAAEAGEQASACRLYERALGLWRAEPLADIDVLRQHPAVRGIAEQLSAAVMEFAGLAAALAQHSRALPHLERLAGYEPFNERVHACLMITLACTGQQAAALQVYDRLRRRLDSALGIAPGAEFRDAHLRILRQELPPLATALSAVPALARPACQIPPVSADFTGRQIQVSQLGEIMCQPSRSSGLPIAVITGMAGVGKTAIALHVAHRLRPSYPGGQLWVQLDGQSVDQGYLAGVLGQLLSALGVSDKLLPSAAPGRAALFRSRLADRHALVLVDDAASAAQVRSLLPGTADCGTIVTSRRRLTGLDGAQLIHLNPLTDAEARMLLCRVLGAERAAAEPRAVDELLAACGNLSLALCIAGAKIAARPELRLSLLARQISARPLDELNAGDMSVRDSITASYNTLDEQAKRAFRLLGHLPSKEATKGQVVAMLAEPDAAEAVEKLVDSSMVTLVGSDAVGEFRCRLHSLLRRYANELPAG